MAMSESKKKISEVDRKPEGQIVSGSLAAPVLAIAGLLTNIVPSVAITPFYTTNDYKACATQLLNAGVTPQAAAQGCASAIRPRDLSYCVASIKQHTQILPGDAVVACSQARRPEELAKCIVGISKNTNNTVNPDVLSYCGHSLLPVAFGQCVVGLREKIDLSPIDAMDTCIDSGDRAGGIAATTIPSNQEPVNFSPTFQTTPVPATPSN